MANELKFGSVNRSAAEEADLRSEQKKMWGSIAQGNGERIDPDFTGLRESDRDAQILAQVYGEEIGHVTINDYGNGKPRKDNNFGITATEQHEFEPDGDAYHHVSGSLQAFDWPELDDDSDGE